MHCTLGYYIPPPHQFDNLSTYDIQIYPQRIFISMSDIPCFINFHLPGIRTLPLIQISIPYHYNNLIKLVLLFFFGCVALNTVNLKNEKEKKNKQKLNSSENNDNNNNNTN